MHTWKTLPDRDAMLEAVYSFLRGIAANKPEEAGEWVQVKDMAAFTRLLRETFIGHLDMVIEDEEWDAYEGADMLNLLSDPAQMDEDLSRPEFSGTTFTLALGESVSVGLGLTSRITPIRLHFQLVGGEGAYHPRLTRITAE